VVQLTGVKSIESDGGPLEGEDLGAEVEVSIGEPRFGWDEIPLAYPMDTAPMPMGWDGLEHPLALNVGNPHVVFFVDDLDAAPLESLGPRIETDGVFPQRINVNVAQPTGDGIRLRTWERGAGLTLACGTGACATAVAAIKSKRMASPVKVTMPGGSLTITWEPGQPIRMRGSATHVFSGELNLEALQ
jgi:diaminopimelate epimerase